MNKRLKMETKVISTSFLNPLQDDAGSALMDLFPSIPENQANFLFSSQNQQELTFDEWFRVVLDFSQMCGKVHNLNSKSVET